ncbi:hypothetical protein JHK87_039657 [Glycine soja]|nr:hypothetical protein JHK87_039657 [Glycine soja]
MLEGSLEDVCEGRPETEEAETRTNQIESKNGNLKDSEPDGCCNIRSSGISRSTHVIGPRRREEAPTIKGGDFLLVGGRWLFAKLEGLHFFNGFCSQLCFSWIEFSFS